ncbi:heat-shock protein Hsp20 [Collibacillus ludicampi]|uniref:Heat-shock protein Hsp20 n=1 Tax=Collibacillus ludicampi TaxID=2771369 RepID=A0AAV4LFG1_9BACL|nr:Hsp20/alpha crystallin family protein [Collibacillus ludicampi]GIM46254.1 heat-shock protein Hsp20 [Collibacillus ludicampi]
MALIPRLPSDIFRPEFLDSLRTFGDVFKGVSEFPKTDIHETPTEVIITAEIPGVEKKDDVKITVHEDHIHLSGKVERVTEQHEENIHRQERFYGHFSRTLSLPSPVDEAGAKASYKNGILEIRLPKIHQETGRQIDIDFS